MPNSPPINSVYVDNSGVAKGDVRGYANTRNFVVAVNADEVRNADWSAIGQIAIHPYFYRKDTGDRTTADDDLSCIVDNVGTRFKWISLTSFVPDAKVANTTARDALDVSAEEIGYAVLVADEGGIYFLLDPSGPTWSDRFEVRGPRGGDYYDYIVWDNGRPSSGEIVSTAIVAREIIFAADMLDSQAKAYAAATAEAVFSIKKNGTEFATVTFAIGATVGTIGCPTETTFAAGDVLTVVAPDPRDETLSGVHMTLAAYRNTSP